MSVFNLDLKLILAILAVVTLYKLFSNYRKRIVEIETVPVALPLKFYSLIDLVQRGELSAHKALDVFEKRQSARDSNSDIWLAKIWLQMKEVESGVYIDSLRQDFDEAYEGLMRWRQKYRDRDIEPVKIAFARLDKRLGNAGM